MRATPRGPLRNVAILGGGPAGSYLGAALARAGVKVVLFTRDKRPPLVIGESLVPAVIPFLRDLGVEQEIAAYSTYKPGATFVLNPGEEMSFTFAQIPNAVTNYSYNVPRDLFDTSVLAAAERAGAKVVRRSVRFEVDPSPAAAAGEPSAARLRLSDDAIAATEGVLDGQPDLLVDASGRARHVATLLGLPSETGPRRDTALFAHLDSVPLTRQGDVHTDRMEHGWSWRIPLPGRVSVGIVVPSEQLAKFGETIEEQYDNFRAKDAVISRWAAGARRMTPVVKYTNYQLATLQGVGPNWALVGDAFGFIDPVFSSGLLVGFDGARTLARAILDGSPRAFLRYERHVIGHLRAWRRVVDSYYDGRLFTLFKVGDMVRHTPMGRIMDRHFQRHMPRVFTGEATRRFYSRNLLQLMCRYGLAGNDPTQLEVH